MSETSFDRVISEHLALCERNKRLERGMPLEGYREPGGESPAEAAPRQDPHWLEPESWDTSAERPLPEFDWGDD